MADTTYYVEAIWKKKSERFRFDSEVDAYKQMVLSELRRIQVKRTPMLGRPKVVPHFDRLVSVVGWEVSRRWLDAGKAPGWVHFPPRSSLQPSQRFEYQVWITSNERPGKPLYVGSYESEYEARDKIAEIDSEGTYKSDSWTPPLTGVKCHLAEIEKRILNGNAALDGIRDRVGNIGDRFNLGR